MSAWDDVSIESKPQHLDIDLYNVPNASTTPVTVSTAMTLRKKLLIITGVIVLLVLLVGAVMIPISLCLTHKGVFATTVTTSIGTTALTTITAGLPSQCSSYTTINDAIHLTTAAGGNGCDSCLFGCTATWVRFNGAGETQLVTTAPNSNVCGIQATGWYTSTLPSSGATINGTVCYVWGSNTCNWNNAILVTNCGSFYVFALILPPICNARYCTI